MMGDWAKGEFIAAGQTPGPGVWLHRARQAATSWAATCSCFPKIDDPAQKAAQDKLAEVMSAPATQVAFNMKKGSVPVRLDVDVSSMDVCAQKGMAELQDPKHQIPSDNFLSTPDLVRRGAGRDHPVLAQPVDEGRYVRRQATPRRSRPPPARSSRPAGTAGPPAFFTGPAHGDRHPAPVTPPPLPRRAPAGQARSAPGGAGRDRRLPRLHALDGATFAQQLQAPADPRLRRPRSVPAPARPTPAS